MTHTRLATVHYGFLYISTSTSLGSEWNDLFMDSLIDPLSLAFRIPYTALPAK